MEITWLGLVAGAITSIAALPQVLRTYRTKHARDISIWQLVLLTVGMLLWLAYGIAIHDLPLIWANVFSLLCYCLLIVLKICYDRADKSRAAVYILKRTEVIKEET